jgi:PHD-like zinc-binding domain/Zinc finger, C3HC4 type (RING finger)/PHD-finger
MNTSSDLIQPAHEVIKETAPMPENFSNKLLYQIATILFNIGKELRCSICLSIFNDAASTPCAHTFCHDCIEGWIVSNHKSCPLCKFPLTKRQISLDNDVQTLVHCYRELQPSFGSDSGISTQFSQLPGFTQILHGLENDFQYEPEPENIPPPSPEQTSYSHKLGKTSKEEHDSSLLPVDLKIEHGGKPHRDDDSITILPRISPIKSSIVAKVEEDVEGLSMSPPITALPTNNTDFDKLNIQQQSPKRELPEGNKRRRSSLKTNASLASGNVKTIESASKRVSFKETSNPVVSNSVDQRESSAEGSRIQGTVPSMLVKTSCGICFSSDFSTDNVLLRCSGCNILVHSECYGAINDNKSVWKCEHCLQQLDSSKMHCSLCPIAHRTSLKSDVSDMLHLNAESQESILPASFEPTSDASDVFRPAIDGSWVHSLCASWIPELCTVTSNRVLSSLTYASLNFGKLKTLLLSEMKRIPVVQTDIFPLKYVPLDPAQVDELQFAVSIMSQLPMSVYKDKSNIVKGTLSSCCVSKKLLDDAIKWVTKWAPTTLIVVNVSGIPASRWNMSCQGCGLRGRGVGACVQCANANCLTGYHPLCAFQGQKGVLRSGDGSSTFMKVKEEEESLQFKLFCVKHGSKEKKKHSMNVLRSQIATPIQDSFSVPPDDLSSFGAATNGAMSLAWISESQSSQADNASSIVSIISPDASSTKTPGVDKSVVWETKTPSINLSVPEETNTEKFTVSNGVNSAKNHRNVLSVYPISHNTTTNKSEVGSESFIVTKGKRAKRLSSDSSGAALAVSLFPLPSSNAKRRKSDPASVALSNNASIKSFLRSIPSTVDKRSPQEIDVSPDVPIQLSQDLNVLNIVLCSDVSSLLVRKFSAEKDRYTTGTGLQINIISEQEPLKRIDATGRQNTIFVTAGVKTRFHMMDAIVDANASSVCNVDVSKLESFRGVILDLMVARRRNHRYLCGLLSGATIVHEEWLKACISDSFIVHEAPYLIHGDKEVLAGSKVVMFFGNEPLKLLTREYESFDLKSKIQSLEANVSKFNAFSRVKLQCLTNHLLFHDVSIIMFGEFECPPKNTTALEVKQIVSLGGGALIDVNLPSISSVITKRAISGEQLDSTEVNNADDNTWFQLLQHCLSCRDSKIVILCDEPKLLLPDCLKLIFAQKVQVLPSADKNNLQVLQSAVFISNPAWLLDSASCYSFLNPNSQLYKVDLSE